MPTKLEELDFGLLPTPAAGQKQIVFGSRDYKGLQFVIKSNGRKEFRFRYVRPEDGRRTTYTIGTYPEIDADEAKSELRKLKNDLNKGVNPTAIKLRKRSLQVQIAVKTAMIAGDEYSFANLATDFLKACKKSGKPNQKTIAKYRTALLHHLLPRIGDLDMRYLIVPEYKKIVEEFAEQSTAKAHNIHSSVRRLCSWCVEHGILTTNPLIGKRDILKTIKVDPRKRHFTTDEIHKFLNELALQGINNDTKLALLIQLHTGLRIGEICALEWDKIHFRARIITHPKSVMKGGKSAETVISDAVFRLLAERRKETQGNGRNRVFPDNFNTSHVVAQVQNLRSWIDFGTHDLRRTVSTYLQEFGCPSDVRDMITNHAGPQGVRRNYDHSKALQLQLTWLNHLAAKLAEIKANPSAVKMAIDLDESDPLMAEFADIL